MRHDEYGRDDAVEEARAESLEEGQETASCGGGTTSVSSMMVLVGSPLADDFRSQTSFLPRIQLNFLMRLGRNDAVEVEPDVLVVLDCERLWSRLPSSPFLIS
jgi:hypothetical protein